jgi:hypothetical protein
MMPSIIFCENKEGGAPGISISNELINYLNDAYMYEPTENLRVVAYPVN